MLQVPDSEQREEKNDLQQSFNVIHMAEGSPPMWTDPINHRPAPGPSFKDCL